MCRVIIGCEQANEGLKNHLHLHLAYISHIKTYRNKSKERLSIVNMILLNI